VLFPDPQEDVEREALLNDIFRLRDAIAKNKTTKKEQDQWKKDKDNAWQTYVGEGVTPSKADLAALSDLRKWLETRIGPPL
jgi:hypothetical protein